MYDWETYSEDYKNICKECRESDLENDEFGDDCPYYHDCLCDYAQSKLIKYLDANKGEIKDGHVIFPTEWWNKMVEQVTFEGSEEV